jgi:tRNA pseudouridine38-40 synthase
VAGALDVGAMQQGARLLEGEHDFAAFQATGSDVVTTVRTLSKSAIADRAIDGLIEYEVTGSGFLRHMVRAIVGTLVEVGRGRQPVKWMSEVLQSRERGRAGRSAPAAGLFLVRVDYV